MVVDIQNRQHFAQAEQVLELLRPVLDPELGISIVDLGLVYDIAVTGDCIDIEMTLTSPACPLSERLSHDVTVAVRKGMPAVNEVRVNFVWQPQWNPMMMSPAARLLLGW